jgi:hypothetical protein
MKGLKRKKEEEEGATQVDGSSPLYTWVYLNNERNKKGVVRLSLKNMCAYFNDTIFFFVMCMIRYIFFFKNKRHNFKKISVLILSKSFPIIIQCDYSISISSRSKVNK